MVYINDNQIKNDLGINNWRNLLRDKIILFTGMMPSIKPAVLITLTGELPQFWHFAKDTLRQMGSREGFMANRQQADQLREIKNLIDRDLITQHDKLADKKRYLSMVFELSDAHGDPARLSDNDRKLLAAVCDLADCSCRTLVITALVLIGGRMTA